RLPLQHRHRRALGPVPHRGERELARGGRRGRRRLALEGRSQPVRRLGLGGEPRAVEPGQCGAAQRRGAPRQQRPGALLRLGAVTGLGLNRFPAGCAVYAVVVDSSSVWASCYASGTVLRVNPSNGVVQTIATGGNPAGLAVSPDGFLYVALANNRLAKIDRVS